MNIKSVCGYCGVGCGIEFDETKLRGDISYPINEGIVCAKGVSELHTIETTNRLLRPKFRTNIDEEYKIVNWDIALQHISSKIKFSDSSKVAFYLSGQLLTEDYYVANKLAKGFINTNNIDTNSRTCMSSAVVAQKTAFGVDYVPVRMDDLKTCDLLILTGSNAAEAHVVFFNKIRKEQKRGMKLIVIDPRYTQTAKAADLYLPINVGSDIDFFNLVALNLIENDNIDKEYINNHTNNFEAFYNKLSRLPKTKMLKRTGLSKAQFEEFMKYFNNNKNIITAWTMGLNQSVQGVDKNLSVINMHLISGKINKEGNGPFSLTGQPNAMGGREVGGFSTTLAVHLDFEKESIKKVENFWKTSGIKNDVGLTATQMCDAALNGDIEVLIIIHTDPIYHLPNRTKTEEAFKNIPLIVEINAYNNSETSNYAHIKLPAAPWGEKIGTQTNMDRTVTRQEKLTRTSIDCKPDWKIICELASYLGFEKDFNYENVEEIFEEFKEMTKLSKDKHLNIYEIPNNEDLINNSFVWGKNLFINNEYFTSNKKANITFVENKRLSDEPTSQYPFVLITGRTRDQWHTGTKTAHVKKLTTYKELEFIEINKKDAKKLDIEDGDLLDISSKYGSISLKAFVTEDINEKTVFIPITVKRINYLTKDLLDDKSFEPDYNHSIVSIKKMY